MKKILSGSLIALSLITNMQAAETSNSEVKATVNKECINMIIPSSINLGDNVNPLEEQTSAWSWAPNGSLASVMTIKWTCSKSTPVDISFSSSNGYKLKKAGASDEITYTFEAKDGRIFPGKGVQDHGGYGIIAAINNTMKPGHYTDIITTTFTW